MRIEVYADVVCPWCYIGERRLRNALQDNPEIETEVSWQPFQLRPEMPEGGLPWHEFAVDKFGGETNMKVAFAHVSDAGSPDGIRFDFDRVAIAPNTVDAHRLILFAQSRGLGMSAAETLFRSYFTEGKNLNDLEHLLQAAVDIGLERGEVADHLRSDDGVAEVWTSQKVAAQIPVDSAPFYIFDGRLAVSGSQSAEVFSRALRTAATPETVSPRNS